MTIGFVGGVNCHTGTSPLYAPGESLTAAPAGGALTPEVVVDIASLVPWTLMLVVRLKCVLPIDPVSP